MAPNSETHDCHDREANADEICTADVGKRTFKDMLEQDDK